MFDSGNLAGTVGKKMILNRQQVNISREQVGAEYNLKKQSRADL